MSINGGKLPMNKYQCTTITDLDQPEFDNANKRTTIIQKGNAKGKLLHTLSGNFNRRSHSVEFVTNNGAEDVCELKRTTKMTTCLSELLQSKNDKINELLQRLGTLHKYNEQFSQENERLVNNIKTMEQRIEMLQQQISDCEKCRRLDMEISGRDNEIKLLMADIEMMKTLTYRLNVQIERYQDTLRNKGLPTNESSQLEQASPKQSTSLLVQWPDGTVRTHTLAPLLQAYDEILHDKEHLIQQYSQQFEQFTGELKEIVKENNCLQEQIDKLQQQHADWREERARLKAQANVSQQKAEVQTKKTDLAKEKLVEVMHCYEQKIQALVLDVEHLQTAYSRCKNELNIHKGPSNASQETINHSLHECEIEVEKLKKDHNAKMNELEQSIKSYKDRCADLQKQIEIIQNDRDLLQSKCNEFNILNEDFLKRNITLQSTCEKLKRSRKSLKIRLRIALQWAHKLQETQNHLQKTWDTLRRFDTVVKHKESQVRGLQARHTEEIDKLEKRLALKEETIKAILRNKLNTNLII